MITGDYSTIGLLVADNASLKGQVDKLTEQVASGHVADSYGGLGAAAATALNLQPQINHLAAQQTALSAVAGRLEVTQTALGRLAAIASSFAAQTVNLNGLSTAQVDTVASSARQALVQVAGLLDSSDGGIYLFAGTDTGNPPVPDPGQIASSGFYAQINAAVLALGTNGAATTVAATLAVAASDTPGTTPFSATIGPVARVLAGGEAVQAGLLANANTLATSLGGSTTGSYARDLLRGLATLASLSSAQLNTAGFGALVADTRTSLQGAVSALATETGALGNTQAAVTAAGTAARDTGTVLLKQVSSVNDVDVAKALTDLSETQTHLVASYKLIAAAKGLSLVQYL